MGYFKARFSQAYEDLDKRYWEWVTKAHPGASILKLKEHPQMVWARKFLSLEEINLLCSEYGANYGYDNDFYLKFKGILNEKLLQLWVE